jgi:hypothetical protein
VRESEPVVLARDLDAERAELRQTLDDVVGDPSLALDGGAVDLALAECPELGEKSLPVFDVLRGGGGVRMDEVEPEPAEVQLLSERRLAPLPLARRLRDRSQVRLPFRYRHP